MTTESIYTQFRQAKPFLNEDLLVNHRLEQGGDSSLGDYLQEKGVWDDHDPKLLAEITPTNLVPIPNLYLLPTDNLKQAILPRIERVQHVADLSLNYLYLNGFNRHGLDHVIQVAATNLRLLREFGIYGDGTQQRAIIGGLCHDLGNVQSRAVHSIISPYWLTEHLLPEVKQDPKQWRQTRKAIYMHNPPVFGAYLDSLETQGMNQTQILDYAQHHLSPDVFTLTIADTTDIRTGRASDRSGLGPHSLDQNIHLALTFHTHPTFVGKSEQNGSFNWEVDFVTQFPSDDLANHYSNLAVAGNTPTMHTSSLFGEDSFDGWYRNFVQTHGPRFAFVAFSAFALDRSLEVFNFVATNPNTGEKKSVTILNPEIYQESTSSQIQRTIQAI